MIDSLSATAGQGLLAMAAAEAALKGWSLKRVEALVRELIPRTRVFGVVDDLSYAVKGGRVPSSVKRIADFLHINPVLTASPEGKMGLSGFHLGRGANPKKLARTIIRKMEPDVMYRVMVTHANNLEAAKQARQYHPGTASADSFLPHHRGRARPGCAFRAGRPDRGFHSAPAQLDLMFLKPNRLKIR